MPKLYLKRGLPGSGKSTSARKMVEKDGNTARINFDDLRAMLWSGKWTPNREKALNAMATQMISSLALSGYNVIVDNTNLSQSHVDRYKNIARNIGMEFVEQRHDVDLLECVYRDNVRKEGHVGRAVIERLGFSSGWLKFQPEEKLVLVDVDGTLADSAWRAEEFLKADEKDWPAFFAASAFDSPIDAVVRWVRNIHESGEYTIVICSGRSDEYADVTVNWLNTNRVPFDHILMRSRSDRREDWIVKQQILNFLPKQQIEFIIDDRQQVIDMWRRVRDAEGLKYRVFQVAEGNF